MDIGIFETIFSEDDFLKPVFFSMEVLDRYYKNPKYTIMYYDYRGSITHRDEHTDIDLENHEYIKNFGIAYHKKDRHKRVIVTFANDLVKLPIKIQGFWYTYMLDSQDEYIPNDGFLRNLICGEWVENISIYQALLMEIHYINDMCKSMKLKPMFEAEYRFDTSNKDDRPLYYHTIVMPTRDCFYSFINTLEKLVVNNLSYKTFLDDTFLIKGIERSKDDGNLKGTLTMLKEWFEKNTRDIDIEMNIMRPLRDLRELRQKPAHKLYENVYDETIWRDQDDMMRSVYSSIRTIRILLANHPLAMKVSIPEVLFSGKNIVSY